MDNVLSIDVGGSFIKGALINKFGEISLEDKIETPNSYELFLDSISQLIINFKNKADNINILGVVIALPGGYDIKNDTIFAPNLKILNSRHVKKDLSEKLQLPVLIENDANLAAYGEFIFSEKKNINSMVFCTLGTGFGGGLILNKKLLQSDMTLFEVGHMSIDYEGVLCSCGRKGCVDEYCSVPGLQRIYEEITGVKEISPIELGNLASKGDEAALKTFNKFGKLLAVAFANLAALFCPEKIKFGGGLSELAPYYLDTCINEFNNLLFPAYAGKVTIELAELKNKAGTLGGAALFFDL